MSDTFLDTKPFLSPSFDPNAYANAVLSGTRYNPDASSSLAEQPVAGPSRRAETKGDVGLELARLNHGIEDVTRQLRQEITTSHPLLLSHLQTSLSLSSHISPIRQSLNSLLSSIDRLHTKIHEPYEQLSILVSRLYLLSQASDLSRRAARFTLLARRLEVQMERVRNAAALEKEKGAVVGKEEGEKDKELAKAALSVAELDALLKPPVASELEGDEADAPPIPLDELEFVKAYIPEVDKARDAIIQEMESMVVAGLADLNQPLLSSSLQTAHNLRLLPDLVSNLLADLNDAVTLRISKAFDSTAIGREVAGKETSSAIKFTSRARPSTEPTSSTQPQWVAILWARLGRVVDDVANCCIKVYTLEKVLRLKKDPVTQTEFLDEVMKSMDDKPSFTFWTTLAKAFETQTKEAARSSQWLQQALSAGYPRLLRLFHDFFAKIAVHTDTVYTREHQSPEAVLVLRSISIFETLYLSRSTTRMTEPVTSALHSYLAGRGNPPGAAEGVQIARAVTNELDSAKFDPLLVRTVARNAVKVLDNLVTKLDGDIVKDFTATSLIGPSATPAQQINAQLLSCLYHCHHNLLFIQPEFGAKVWSILLPTLERLQQTYAKQTALLDAALRKELSSILARLHKTDFAKPVDPMSMSGGGGSAYMQDLIDKLAFVKAEILGRMSLGEFMRDWTLELSRFILRAFLLHASIARPLAESGKLKITGDMTELEIGLSSLLNTGQVQGTKKAVRIDKAGEEYLALRAFRTILFSPLATLADPVETVHLPLVVVLHHILVQSALRLPHEVHGWSEQEYVMWLAKHEGDEERVGLIKRAVEDQVGSLSLDGPVAEAEKVKHSGNGNGSAGNEDGEDQYLKLIKEVLLRATEDGAAGR